MSKLSNQYFEKTENGTTYCIYIMDFDGDPWLCRSALDKADGVHGALVRRINTTIFALYNNVMGRHEHIEKARDCTRRVDRVHSCSHAS